MQKRARRLSQKDKNEKLRRGQENKYEYLIARGCSTSRDVTVPYQHSRTGPVEMSGGGKVTTEVSIRQ